MGLQFETFHYSEVSGGGGGDYHITVTVRWHITLAYRT